LEQFWHSVSRSPKCAARVARGGFSIMMVVHHRHEEEGFSVTEDALQRSNHEPAVLDASNPLGLESCDHWVHSVLLSAGVTVELVKKTAEPPFYAMQQLTDASSIALNVSGNVNAEEIQYADKEYTHGIRVVLNGVHRWKVTIVEENLETHAMPGRRVRTSRPGKLSTFFNGTLYEITVPVPGVGLQCCAATMLDIVITVAFARDDSAMKKAQWKQNLPVISQRRIDALFTNKFVTSMQVRAFQLAFQNACGGAFQTLEHGPPRVT
jgi:hypothetical protein